MAFSPEWDEAYRAAGHLSIWPWSDLVSLVYRHARPQNGFRRVLECGSGAGANIPLFLGLKADYFGIEGSPHIVAQLQQRYPEIKDQLVAGDFTRDIPFEGAFDLVVDRGSLTHNTVEGIARALSLIFSRLRPGGKFIGVDWFSTEHSDAEVGERLDAWTRRSSEGGQFAGLGAVHFTDKQHLLHLVNAAGFAVEYLEHKQVDMHIASKPGRRASWNFVAVRP
ncbi:MAG TPA: class I SAM-dependent methyltransferase [Pseudolabrys sp.]|nr:class I SAM-dependent methyltransferase [Pseudolabrys sp.]